MASAAATASKNMLSLLSTRSFSSPTKRGLSILASSSHRPAITSSAAQSQLDTCIHVHQRRSFSKYVAVTHSTAYEKSIASMHGTQLNLALEESRNKDDTPFDPFSQFLDMMGNSSEDGDDTGLEEIQDAEFEEIDAEEGDDYEEDEEGDDEVAELPTYTTTGALFRPKSERHALRAGYPAGGRFAVIHLEGFQHKVTSDDLLVVNKLKPVAKWSVGSTHTLRDEDILLVADQNQTLVGLPGVKGAEVDVMVEEITRDKTVIVFKKRRRKHSRRKNGHRRQVTFLRVLGVRFPGEKKENYSGDNEVRVAA
ncbi:hypothetical protein ACHAXN_007673 [Cyclotella atomus]